MQEYETAQDGSEAHLAPPFGMYPHSKRQSSSRRVCTAIPLRLAEDRTEAARSLIHMRRSITPIPAGYSTLTTSRLVADAATAAAISLALLLIRASRLMSSRTSNEMSSLVSAIGHLSPVASAKILSVEESTALVTREIVIGPPTSL